MEPPISLWVGLFGAFMGLAVGSLCEWVDGWKYKLPMLTAALGGILGALLYFLIWDRWTVHKDCGLHPVVSFLAAVGGGILGWANGPRKTPEEERKEHLERWRKHCEREGWM